MYVINQDYNSTLVSLTS